MMFFIFIIVIIFLFIVLIVYYYIFNIYETTVKIIPENLVTSADSKVTIELIPVNALGSRVPYRQASAEFMIRKGKDLINNIENDQGKGKLTLLLKGITGTITIIIKSNFSLLPNEIDIDVIPDKK